MSHQHFGTGPLANLYGALVASVVLAVSSPTQTKIQTLMQATAIAEVRVNPHADISSIRPHS